MRLRLIPPLVSIALVLGACAASTRPDPIAIVPAIPPDVLQCRQKATAVPDRDLNAGEIERLWKTDRARLAKVDGCFCRLIVQYCTLREGLSDKGCEGFESQSCGQKAMVGK